MGGSGSLAVRGVGVRGRVDWDRIGPAEDQWANGYVDMGIGLVNSCVPVICAY